MKNDPLIESAIKNFSKLPGFGPRSARRTVMHFLKNKELIKNFAENLNELEQKVRLCSICFNIATKERCSICEDSSRDGSKICIVAEADDIWNIEKSGIFDGVYHCLGGSLSAISGITPEKLTLSSLFSRLVSTQFNEIIFANNFSIEGATTVFYILEDIEKLKAAGKIKDLKITELANGIPIGANLEYMDEGTIEIAFKSRKDLK